MRFDRALLCLMLIGCLWTTVISGRAEDKNESAEKGDILVIYPEEAYKRGRADNLSAIAQVLFSLRYHVDWSEAEEAANKIGSYDKVIWCASTDSDRLDPTILDHYDGYLMVLGQAGGMERFGLFEASDLRGNLIGAAEYVFPDNLPFRASVEVKNAGIVPDADYSNGSVSVFADQIPLISGSENFRYIPLIDYTTDFAKAVLMYEFEKWFWTWDVGMHTWAEHIVLDAVYPFFDLTRLQEIVEYMVALKMNFVISVMPIYEHADYPAMQRFCEVLRFAQANGGGVVLHSPIIQNGIEHDELAKQLSNAAENYLENGVWLLGLEIPSEWIFDQDILDVLGRSRTLFISDLYAFESHSVNDYDLDDYLALGSQQIVPALKLDDTGISHIARCPTAVYLDPGMTENEIIIPTIDAVKDSPIPMQSLWDMDQALFLDEFIYLTWDRNTLIVNGDQKFNVYVPTDFEENFDYKRNIYYRFVTNLANQNHFLIGMSGVILALFIFLVFQSRQQMRNRFLRKKPNEPEGGESL